MIYKSCSGARFWIEPYNGRVHIIGEFTERQVDYEYVQYRINNGTLLLENTVQAKVLYKLFDNGVEKITGFVSRDQIKSNSKTIVIWNNGILDRLTREHIIEIEMVVGE